MCHKVDPLDCHVKGPRANDRRNNNELDLGIRKLRVRVQETVCLRLRPDSPAHAVRRLEEGEGNFDAEVSTGKGEGRL